jgi:hypothetical protein
MAFLVKHSLFLEALISWVLRYAGFTFTASLSEGLPAGILSCHTLPGFPDCPFKSGGNLHDLITIAFLM